MSVMLQPLKILLAQLNYKVGDFAANKEKIVNAIDYGSSRGVDLVVFSELAVCGYPPMDLLTREEFVKNAIQTIHDIATRCTGIAALVGGPSLNPGPSGKLLFNSAWLLSNGLARPVAHKTLLPTYDVFDEYRYFQPNQAFELAIFKGHRLAVTICEDLWDDKPMEQKFDRGHLYTLSPMEELHALNPDIVINIAASPFSFNQPRARASVICSKASRYNLPVVYVNQVGANTGLVFDGGSMVVEPDGKIGHRMPLFSEGYHFFETGQLSVNQPVDVSEREFANEVSLVFGALVLGTRDYFRKSGIGKVVLGLSGGLDSAVTAVIGVEALGAENVHALLMPSQYSSDHSISDAVQLAVNLGISYDVISISELFNQFNRTLGKVFENRASDITEENLQARARGTILMAYSNKFGHAVLNTSNKSEAAVGYGTLYGDMCGALSVLGDVYKTMVVKLAHHINREGEVIPGNSISKPPSAELRPNQQDTDSLPPYDILDAILFRYIELNESLNEIVSAGFDREVASRVIKLVDGNEYKRFQSPPVLRVSSRAFGLGRRMPIVAKTGSTGS